MLKSLPKTTERRLINPFSQRLNTIHVLLAVDHGLLQGLPNLIHSVLSNTRSRVRFHIMWCEKNTTTIIKYLNCFNIPKLGFLDYEIVDDVGRYMSPVFWKYLHLTGSVHKKPREAARI